MKGKEKARRMIHGKQTVIDRSTGETYNTWGPDNSERAKTLRKKMFR